MLTTFKKLTIIISFSAPDIRFSFASLLILCTFPIIFLKKYILKHRKVIKFSLILIGVFFFLNFAVTGYETFINEFKSFEKTEKYLYLPKDVYYIKLNRQIEYTAKDFKTPKGNFIPLFEPKIKKKQCFDKFPCSWFLNDSFELRGESIDKGFNSKIKDNL